jgi:hypothetical protein
VTDRRSRALRTANGRTLDVSERAFESRVTASRPEDLALDASSAIIPPSTAISPRRAVATPASEIRRERVTHLDPGRVPFRMVTVLAGNPGLGKSQWSCALAARVSRGEHGRPPATVLLLTAEDSWSMTVRPRLEAAQADLELVRFVSIATEEGEDGLTIPDDGAELERLVAEHRVELVVVDPLVAHLPSGVDSHKDQSVRRALAPLHRIADEHGCAIVALVHLNKAQGLAPLQRLGGSVAFGAFARSVLLLDRDPDDPDGDEGHQRVLAHIKCNVGPLAPSLLFRVAPILLPAADGNPETETSRLDPIGESNHNGRSLLAVANEDERSAVDEAVAFLEAELGVGVRRPAADLQREAHRIGITDSTLRRARKRLGVETAKADFNRGWEWWVPKAPTTQPPPDPDDTRRLRENPLANRRSAAAKPARDPEGVTSGQVAPSEDLRAFTARLPQNEQTVLDLLIETFQARERVE